MTFTQLESLVAIAEAGSYSKAAKILFVTAPALHQQMRALESELGCKLFRGDAHGVSLTEEGAEYVRAARTSIEAFRAARTRSAELQAARAQTVRVGLNTHSPGLVTMRTLSFINRQHPCPVEVRLVPSTHAFGLDGLLTGQYDCKEYFDTPDVHGAGLAFSLVCEHPYSVVVAPGHVLTSKAAVRGQDLRGLQVGVHCPDACPWLVSWLDTFGISHVEEVPLQADRVAGFCYAGGAYLMTEPNTRFFSGLAARPLPDAPRARVGFVHAAEPPSSVAAFVRLAREALGA